MNIEWKDIPNYVGSYQISNIGQVRSLARTIHVGSHTRRIRGKQLAIYRSGYFSYVHLSKGGTVERVGIQEIMREVW